MKKLLALSLVLIMIPTFLTACFSDPVADELEKFLNTDMVTINENYEALKAELGKWEGFETDEQIVTSLKDVLIPNVDASLDMLSKIELTTDEIKSIKDKYKKVLDTYKEGFETMLEGANNGDSALLENGAVKLEEGVTFLDEYNSALESLASLKGLTIEY